MYWKFYPKRASGQSSKCGYLGELTERHMKTLYRNHIYLTVLSQITLVTCLWTLSLEPAFIAEVGSGFVGQLTAYHRS